MIIGSDLGRTKPLLAPCQTGIRHFRNHVRLILLGAGGTRAICTLALRPELYGKPECRIRIFPTHPSRIDKFETGSMVWR